MLNDDRLQYNGLLGSNVNGEDLVRLSVGTTAMVFVFIPFTMLLVIALVLIFKSASMKGPGRGGTSHLTDFDETWPV